MLSKTSVLLLFTIAFTICITNIHCELDDASGSVEDSDLEERAWEESNEEESELDKRRTQTIPQGKKRKTIQALIAKWNLPSIEASRTSGSIVKPGALPDFPSARIDNQSPITKNGRRYFNVQAQLNSDTYSTVFIPAGVNLGVRKIRNALVESMKSGKHWIFVPPSKKGRPWTAKAE